MRYAGPWLTQDSTDPRRSLEKALPTFAPTPTKKRRYAPPKPLDVTEIPFRFKFRFPFLHLLGVGPNRPIGSLAPVSGSILTPRRSTLRWGVTRAYPSKM